MDIVWLLVASRNRNTSSIVHGPESGRVGMAYACRHTRVKKKVTRLKDLARKKRAKEAIDAINVRNECKSQNHRSYQDTNSGGYVGLLQGGTVFRSQSSHVIRAIRCISFGIVLGVGPVKVHTAKRVLSLGLFLETSL